MMSDSDLGWLAGLLEGEGSFMMGRNIVNKKLYLYPKIVVTMTDRDVIDRAAKLLGNNTYIVPPAKNKPETRLQQYRAQISGVRAAEIMNQLMPHMGQRRRSKMEEILTAYGEIESTEIRRARSNSITQKARWAKYGTREGKLLD